MRRKETYPRKVTEELALLADLNNSWSPRLLNSMRYWGIRSRIFREIVDTAGASGENADNFSE